MHNSDNINYYTVYINPSKTECTINKKRFFYVSNKVLTKPTQ